METVYFCHFFWETLYVPSSCQCLDIRSSLSGCDAQWWGCPFYSLHHRKQSYNLFKISQIWQKKCGQVTKRPTCTPLSSQIGIWWKRIRGTWSTGGWWCCASEQSPLRHSCTRLRTALPSENKLFVLWVFPNMLWKLCNTACFFLLGWFNFWDGSRTIEWRSGILFPSFLTCYPPTTPPLFFLDKQVAGDHIFTLLIRDPASTLLPWLTFPRPQT